MAKLKVLAGVLASRSEELEIGLEAAFLPEEWVITIVASPGIGFRVAIEMQHRLVTRTFASRSLEEVIEFLRHVGRESGGTP